MRPNRLTKRVFSTLAEDQACMEAKMQLFLSKILLIYKALNSFFCFLSSCGPLSYLHYHGVAKIDYLEIAESILIFSPSER